MLNPWFLSISMNSNLTPQSKKKSVIFKSLCIISCRTSQTEKSVTYSPGNTFCCFAEYVLGGVYTNCSHFTFSSSLRNTSRLNSDIQSGSVGAEQQRAEWMSNVQSTNFPTWAMGLCSSSRVTTRLLAPSLINAILPFLGYLRDFYLPKSETLHNFLSTSQWFSILSFEIYCWGKFLI